MVNKRYRIEPMPDRQYPENITFREFSIKLGSLALAKFNELRNTIDDKLSQFGYAVGFNEPTINQEQKSTENDEQI